MTRPPQRRAFLTGLFFAGVLAALIVLGSRNLAHFDAALVGYTFATLVRDLRDHLPLRDVAAAAADADVLAPRAGRSSSGRGCLRRNLLELWSAARARGRRQPVHLPARPVRAGSPTAASCGAASWRRPSPSRWSGAGSTSRPCPATSTATAPSCSASRPSDSAIESAVGFIVFHGLVWASLLVHRGRDARLPPADARPRRGGAAAVRRGHPAAALLFAISVTGLLLTVSYTWMKGYAYDFLAILHAVTVIFTLLWLPFGKFFHVFQRPAQLGVASTRTAEQRAEQAQLPPLRQRVRVAPRRSRTSITVERELGFRYELARRRGATTTSRSARAAAALSMAWPSARARHSGGAAAPIRRRIAHGAR